MTIGIYIAAAIVTLCVLGLIRVAQTLDAKLAKSEMDY